MFIARISTILSQVKRTANIRGGMLFMVLKYGRFGQQIRNTWKVLKCGAGEGWRRSVGPIV